MVQDHSDSNGSFKNISLPVKPALEHWLEREIAQWFYHEGSIQAPIAPRVNPQWHNQ